MANSNSKSPEMKVLSLGLPRTGSASMAEALTILGYKNVHHGIKIINDNKSWEIIGRAADATFPVLPTYTGALFTRAQWDELFGSCEGATDVAGVFATQLVDIYPEASVILTIRDFDKWQKSVNDALSVVWSFGASIAIKYAEPLVGHAVGRAVRKVLLGFLGSNDVDEARGNMREVYDRHNKALQELVPADRLLVYHLGQGWEPICAFLGKPVPDVEFPWLNESAALRAMMEQRIRAHLVGAAKKALPWLCGVVVLAIGLSMAVQRR